MSRRGASLLEALVAMAIVGGPLLAVIGLIVSNTRGTHHTQDHLAAEMYLQDMLELLAVTCSDPHSLVKAESSAGAASPELEELMAGRASLPASFAPELQRRLAEFAEQMQGQQRLAWADNAIKLAVDMTVAAVERVNLQGNAEAQAEQIRTVMARVFPEAVTLVREAREGLQ